VLCQPSESNAVLSYRGWCKSRNFPTTTTTTHMAFRKVHDMDVVPDGGAITGRVVPAPNTQEFALPQSHL
jgi:hypothetical protein